MCNRENENLFLFYLRGFYLKDFIVHVVIPTLLPFCKEEFIDFRFEISGWNFDFVGGHI